MSDDERFRANYGIAKFIEHERYWFTENKDPVHALRSLAAATRHQVVIPTDITQWLGTVAQAYLDSEGQRSFDELAGLTRGEGKKMAITQYRTKRWRVNAMGDFKLLHVLFEINLSDGAEMVALRYPDRTASTLRKYGQKHIAAIPEGMVHCWPSGPIYLGVCIELIANLVELDNDPERLQKLAALLEQLRAEEAELLQGGA